MKIITFNIKSSNKHIKEDLKTLHSLNADVYCIQEFPKESYNLLEKLFKKYFISKCREYFLTNSTTKKSLRQLNIILSRYEFQKENTILHIPMEKISFLYKITLKTNFSIIESHYVDIIIENTPLRIVNLHLECFTSPKFRIQQFNHIYKSALKDMNHDNILFVGDFNIFAKPIYNWILAPFFGFSFKDLWTNEHLEFEQEISQKKLQIYFPNSSTLKRIPISCDGVISKSKHLNHNNKIEVKKNVIKTSSDHYIIEIIFHI